LTRLVSGSVSAGENPVEVKKEKNT
jgi:hypothetical protein